MNKIIRRFKRIPADLRDQLASSELAENGALLGRLARLSGDEQ
ncbi:MAG: hypothetical protein P4L71_21845 [Acetobacteraceae bacterium]|nr:hypothetical protein [Acetobacteraceae bacterium]